jgi:hypothetical protein
MTRKTTMKTTLSIEPLEEKRLLATTGVGLPHPGAVHTQVSTIRYPTVVGQYRSSSAAAGKDAQINVILGFEDAAGAIFSLFGSVQVYSGSDLVANVPVNRTVSTEWGTMYGIGTFTYHVPSNAVERVQLTLKYAGDMLDFASQGSAVVVVTASQPVSQPGRPIQSLTSSDGTRYLLDVNSELWSSPSETSVWTLIDTGVISCALGSGVYAGDVVDLHANGSLYGNIGHGFIVWDSGVTSFAIAPAGYPWYSDIIDLHNDGTLYGNVGAFGNNGRGFAPWDFKVTSFAIAQVGSPWYGDIIDLHNDGTLYGNVGAFGNNGRGFAPWDFNVMSFAIAPAGYPGYFIRPPADGS